MAWSMTLSTPDGNVPYGDALTYTRKLSDTCDWSMSVKQDLRELEPDGADYPDVFNQNAYDTDGVTYAKLLSLSGTDDSNNAWSLPSGVPDAYSWGINGGEIDASFTWRGKSTAAKLYRPHLSLPSVVSTSVASVTVRDVLGTILDAYGLSYDVSAVSPNYVVPRMQMQDGSPIEWVRQLLEVTQGEWYEDNNGSIVCMQPDWSGSGADYTYETDETHLRGYSVSVNAVSDFANYIVCQRADDVGGVIARSDKQDTTFGLQGVIEFENPVPVTSITWVRKLELLGVLSDFYFYGPDGPPAAPIAVRDNRAPAPPTQAGTEAHSVQFTFGAYPGGPVGVTKGSYSVEFRADTTGGIYPDTTTSIAVQNTTSISSGRGKVQTTLGPNPLIADATTLQTWGDRVLYKRSRTAVNVSATLNHLEMGLKPGMAVKIHDVLKDKNYRIIVRSVSHNLVPDRNSRVTSFEGVQYVL